MLILCAALGVAAYTAIAAAVAVVHWRSANQRPPTLLAGHFPKASVVVAARNEELTIASCLAALLAQDYPAARFNIVVVDDHSEDATAERVREIASLRPGVRLIEAQAARATPGKASALALGIELSDSDVILTTDADCVPPVGWARNMVSRLENESLVVLGGPTRVRARSRFHRVQAMDWMLGFAVAGGASDLGFPLTAMGNNMSFRRAAYEAVGGYRRFMMSPTEDYELFRALGKLSGGRARLLLEDGLTVTTEPARSIGSVLSQRRRWARGALNTSAVGYVLYAAIWLAHMFPLVLLPLGVVPAAACFAVKVAADVLVLGSVGRRLGTQPAWSVLLEFELFLMLYVTSMPLSLMLAPSHRWKGRKLARQRSVETRGS